MTTLAVVHLVRAANGLEPFRRFLESYRTREAGREHRLVLLCKGFADEAGVHEYRRLLDGEPHDVFLVPDEGYDVGPYLTAARRLRFDYFCFLNSFSVLRSDRWLAKLYEHASRPGVGLVGATGSYGSVRSHVLWYFGCGSAYEGLLEQEGRWLFPRSFANTVLLRPQRRCLHGWKVLWREMPGFLPFPAAHVRTNAFMISRALAAGVRCGPLRDKVDAYRFESGKHGLTRQVLARNLKTLLVGDDGEAYDVEQWPESETFWQGRQRNLLVADNQTATYESGDAARRKFLSRYAWGERARPAPC